ncbi:MAG: flagellar hook-basal body complex protein [Oscillibacter sp.]|nr:flagellar hook-basal body complex protein [Oscillibacter sp.]
MTGAMYAAIGGLKTHMTNLNVIGNNIANVNTTAYKAQRMIFQESLYTTRRAGSDGTAVRGGNTPSQIGYGAQVGSIDLNMSPGTFSPTGFALDCMIDGDGFFLVGDKDMVLDSGDNLNRAMLTRAGDFDIDPKGYITDGQGNVVFGFQMVYNPNYVEGADEAAIAAAKLENPPRNIQDKLILSTQLVPLRVPLRAQEPTIANGGIDPASGEHLWEAGDPVYDILGSCLTTGSGDNSTQTTERKNVSLANVGYYADGGTGALDWTLLRADKGEGAGTSTGMAEGDAMNYTIPKPNFNDEQAGTMSLSINENGAIISTADNGDAMIIGYIAIGQVTAPNGVTHTGGPYYKAQEGAGELTVGIAGGIFPAGTYLNNAIVSEEEGGYTPELKNLLGQMKAVKVQGSGLEASTADVATEFANMILTQRGYQANTRIVTVTDSMLEELVNMKR